ncbi:MULTISPECIES: Lrp/AsnC family transcriptional regulator [Ferroplasma]|jgi:DNA-binding Lrp family transcriptional regulator|uniref:Transcriptional regulatory protein n=2 Tax=Ferroplasma TaxID=74968 RepID=S0AS51_FERAC|nr:MULTISPECIES: Lrp/AsnC family transcriptional regulator [Ferroplasma]AGO61801.1 transcriptional regulatory protein [Ferroplasma acidarmanus Fer1]MCL4349739.1 Lrp/AsnC family transcriptional regulator [Candidatus Thermoplasmatota archaeon]NOL59628.1 Lrp/AsnC family transcriptional regulator [Ferroplasma acidiphilum]WMT53646.1 MAG: Lrp/AsnC family transcriptional regulator [Ferroplasma acidiphilum]
MLENIDKKDMKIIEYLKEHGRDKISDISNALQIPRATIFERMERLRKDGFIKKYTVDLNYDKLGYSVMSYIMIQYNPKASIDQRTLCLNLSKMDNVISASIVTGDWDIVLLTAQKSMRDLSKFVLEQLRTMDGIEKSVTIPLFERVL